MRLATIMALLLVLSGCVEARHPPLMLGGPKVPDVCFALAPDVEGELLLQRVACP